MLPVRVMTDPRICPKARLRPSFICRLAGSPADIQASQRLRYRVFAEEMGARLPTADQQLDYDEYDPACTHLLVCDERSGALAASTRILVQEQASRVGGFYSASEFDLTRLLNRPGRFLEIGRTCVAPEYRSGAAIASLWRGLSHFVNQGRYDQLIGCASVAAGDGGAGAHAIFRRLSRRHLVEQACRVAPKRPLPRFAGGVDVPRLPPLLRAYLSLGARVGGPPCLDPAFGVADFFIHLQLRELVDSYARHFNADTPHAGRHRAVA
jgi:putative hemolysin